MGAIADDRRGMRRQEAGMAIGRLAAAALAVLALTLAGCGGEDEDGGGDTHPLGEEVVVNHYEASGAKRSTTLGITVEKVRKGTQQQLADAGFQLEPEEKSSTPYYVDTRLANQGSSPTSRLIGVSLEDADGSSVSATTVINLGGEPFARCPQASQGDIAPGATFERCQLFLLPEGKEPRRVSFLPYDPENPTDFVYWDAA
jgi:hypothetical protein